MKIRQLRNATLLIYTNERCILVDPMLAPPASMPGFKMVGGGRQRNPLVPMPEQTFEWIEEVTDVLITHEHPDHFDPAGLKWVINRGLPVWTNSMDAKNLHRKGLDVHLLETDTLAANVEVVRSKHGRGIVGWLMGPVAGYYLGFPDEPSLYLTGDSILTNSVLDAVDRLSPDIIVAPAGTANMGFGGDILFSIDELVTLAKRMSGRLVLNHLEALDHCPTTRTELRERMAKEGFATRVDIPADGELLQFPAHHGSRQMQTHLTAPKPGFQKWLTAKFSGTSKPAAPNVQK